MQSLNSQPSTSSSSATADLIDERDVIITSIEPAVPQVGSTEERARELEQLEQVTQQRPRSLSMQWRFVRVVAFALWLFVRVIFWNLLMQRYFPERVQRGNMRRWQGYARQFRGFAIEMGGVMIKLGQFISTRSDVLPPEITNELATLRDEVPSVSTEKIRAIIERELGPISARFSWFEDKPVAAASLGQVHRARLLNGDRVVIKVLRPGIIDICHTDLAALDVVARVAMRFKFVSRRMDAVALATEFGRVLIEELSYRHEARNAARFAAMFRDDLGVYIPAVYAEHSTDRVITLEDVTTIKLDDYEALEAAGISRKAVAKRLSDTYLKQIFEHRFFHADPHPGNLFVYPLPEQDADGKRYPNSGSGRPFYLIFIDFGMTGSLTPQIADGLISTLGAVISRDSKKMVESYKELGFLLPSADTARLEEATRAVFDQVWGLTMQQMGSISYESMANLGKEFNDLLFTMPFQVPQDFIYLGRSVSILSGLCTSLDPSFNPWNEIQPYTQKILTQRLLNSGGAAGGSVLGLPSLQNLVGVGQQLITRAIAPQASPNDVLARIQRGDLTVRVEPSAAYQRQLERIEAQSRRTTRAVVFGSLLITSTIFATGGQTAPAVIGYALTGVSLLWTWLSGD